MPTCPAAQYDIILEDTTSGVNSTATQFEVLTSYLVNAVPAQIQEGSSVTFNVTVTGGGPDTLPTSLTFLLSFQDPLGT